MAPSSSAVLGRDIGPRSAFSKAVGRGECRVSPGGVKVQIVPADILVDHRTGRGMGGQIVDHAFAHDPDAPPVAQRLAVLRPCSHLSLPATARSRSPVFPGARVLTASPSYLDQPVVKIIPVRRIPWALAASLKDRARGRELVRCLLGGSRLGGAVEQAGDRVDQFLVAEWLADSRAAMVLQRQARRSITGDKNKRDVPPRQNFSNRKDALPTQIDVEYGSVTGFDLGRIDCFPQPRNRPRNDATRVFQNILNQRGDEILILHHQYSDPAKFCVSSGGFLSARRFRGRYKDKTIWIGRDRHPAPKRAVDCFELCFSL